jgi:hypothetical protein
MRGEGKRMGRKETEEKNAVLLSAAKCCNIADVPLTIVRTTRYSSSVKDAFCRSIFQCPGCAMQRFNYLITSECIVSTTDQHPVPRMSPLRQHPSVCQSPTCISDTIYQRFLKSKAIKTELPDFAHNSTDDSSACRALICYLFLVLQMWWYKSTVFPTVLT